MRKEILRVTTCCVTSAMLLTATPATVHASIIGGAAETSSVESEKLAVSSDTSVVAGASLAISNYLAKQEVRKSITKVKESVSTSTGDSNEETKEGNEETAGNEEEKTEEQSEYANIAVAQVDNYVNIRSTASQDGEILGKLYNNSVATVTGIEGEWYQVTSGTVNGYIKSEFVVVGDEGLIQSVSRNIATVNADVLRIRSQANTEAEIINTVPNGTKLNVVSQMDGWVEISTETGTGFVSSDFVTCETVYTQAESREEEAARLAREEEERRAREQAAAEEAARKQAEEAAQAAASQSSSQAAVAAPSGSGGSAVASYAGQFVGNPYVYGGTSLTNGADCSGFVMSVYAQFGVSLPHSSSAMRSCGYEVSYDQAQPGDIICYSGHVAIYAGNGTIVHASTPESGIKYSPATYTNIVSVRRIF